MALSNQSTKLRLLNLLQHSYSTHPNKVVSLSKMAQTLSISRERVRQLYRQLAVEYALPPVRKWKRGFDGVNQRKPFDQANTTASKPDNNGGVTRKLRIPSPQTLALEADVQKYISQNMSIPEIARKIGRPAPTIYTALQRLGIPFKRVKGTRFQKRSAKTLAIEEEVRKYSEQGLTVAEIVERTGRSESNIQRIHHRLHIPLPPRRKSPQVQALEAETRRYSEQGMTVAEIAKRTGRPERTIYTYLHHLRIPRKLVGKAAYKMKKSPQTRALEDEVRALSEQGMTVAEIAKRTGRPVQTIYRILRRLGKPILRKLKKKSHQTQALEEEVRKYSEQGMTPPEIAQKIGKPRSTIYSVLSRISIPSKRVKDTGLRNQKTLAFEAEVRMYLSLGMNATEIAKITGRGENIVLATIHRLGIPLSKRSRNAEL